MIWKVIDMVELYPDQADLVGRIRQSMRHSKGVLMQSPTGSGKTRMALDMIAGVRQGIKLRFRGS